MLGIEEVLSELKEEINEAGLPPGFRFHPTDEELVTFYLASKVFNNSHSSSTGINFAQVDLNRCEPWDLPDVAKMGEREWYFYSLRDRKYPTGMRTNRATGGGYWKATGKDREIFSNVMLVGMKKTLVFYKGRAPRGQKTSWVMHEYRLHAHFSSHKEEWVICRIFHKIKEKKSPPSTIFQSNHHPYFLATHSCPTTIPPLLESQPDPDQHHDPSERRNNNNHNGNRKLSINAADILLNESASNLIKEKSFLLSNQTTPTATTISSSFPPIHYYCKTEPSNYFSPFQETTHDDANHDYNGLDFNALGFSTFGPPTLDYNTNSIPLGSTSSFDFSKTASQFWPYLDA